MVSFWYKTVKLESYNYETVRLSTLGFYLTSVTVPAKNETMAPFCVQSLTGYVSKFGPSLLTTLSITIFYYAFRTGWQVHEYHI